MHPFIPADANLKQQKGIPSQQPASSVSSVEIKKFQDEINSLLMQNAALESSLAQLKRESKDSEEVFKKELETTGLELSQQVKEMEKSLKTLKSEKEEMYRELLESQEKLKLQSKELKDALGQRKLAMTEYTEVSDKLAELRSQKQKLSRQVRDKEEEVEKSLAKMDALRADLRKAERLRREFEARVEEAGHEAQQEKRLRQRSEELCQHLQAELDVVRKQLYARSPTSGTAEDAADGSETDVSQLKNWLAEAERQRDHWKKEAEMMKDRVDLMTSEAEWDRNEQVTELKRVYAREKGILEQENERLTQELEALKESFNNIQHERRKLEDELNETKDKREVLPQWEAQISEIIQWVTEEKDARGYLQALATKMTEELEGLKSSSSSTSHMLGNGLSSSSARTTNTAVRLKNIRSWYLIPDSFDYPPITYY